MEGLGRITLETNMKSVATMLMAPSVPLFVLINVSVAPAIAHEEDDRAILSQTTRDSEEPAKESGANTKTNTLCQMIGAAAVAAGLPPDFFARIIARESDFRADAVGPVTRSGQRAQGIAQFMPATAAERLVADPFDPVQALPKAAELLRDLRAQFGNLGLAAAAYNAGPARVRNWLAGKEALPAETRAYVQKVTGRSAQEWAGPAQPIAPLPMGEKASCDALALAEGAAKSHPLISLAQPPPTTMPVRSTAGAWIIQLTGDKSQIRALSMYRDLQRRHPTLLRTYEPVIALTTLRGSAVPIWTRVRINANTRQIADTLCTQLRAAGESCLVQRN